MRLMHDFLLYGESDHLPPISQTEPLMWQPTYVVGDGRLWSDIMVRLICKDELQF